MHECVCRKALARQAKPTPCAAGVNARSMLENRDFLVVYRSPGEVSFVDIPFRDRSFCYLVGIEPARVRSPSATCRVSSP